MAVTTSVARWSAAEPVLQPTGEAET